MALRYSASPNLASIWPKASLAAWLCRPPSVAADCFTCSRRAASSVLLRTARLSALGGDCGGTACSGLTMSSFLARAGCGLLRMAVVLVASFAIGPLFATEGCLVFGKCPTILGFAVLYPNLFQGSILARGFRRPGFWCRRQWMALLGRLDADASTSHRHARIELRSSCWFCFSHYFTFAIEGSLGIKLT